MDRTVGEIFTVTVTPSQIVTSSAAVGKAAPVPAAQLVADQVRALQLPELRAKRAAACAFDVSKHAVISNTDATVVIRTRRAANQILPCSCCIVA
ncbi:MAG TPA: hypothetical protein VN496_01240, partial [Burkholderiales bacterium]|nr:hypothetical protein [Burkholderiales bacterium]